MTAGFRVWPDPPVYLTHHAVANTCHFKGATLQNIHINTPVTLTNTHTLFYHTPHSINLKGQPRFTLWIGIVPFDIHMCEETFPSSHFCDLEHAAASLSLPLRVIRAAAGGWAMKMMMMDPHNRPESCLPEQLTWRKTGNTESRLCAVIRGCDHTHRHTLSFWSFDQKN